MPLITMLPSGMMCSMETKRMTSGSLDNGDHRCFCLDNPMSPLTMAPWLRSLTEGAQKRNSHYTRQSTSFLCRGTGCQDDEQLHHVYYGANEKFLMGYSKGLEKLELVTV